MKMSAQRNPPTSAAAAPASAAEPKGRGLSTPWRVVISAAILVHLTAVFTGPWAFAPLHSPLADDFYRALRPYIEGLALSNGYRFFAPEPGPSHLLRYEMVLADGSRQEGMIPNLKTEWPRLLYHRHFMLSEFLNSIDTPGAPKGLAQTYAESFAEHLAYTHDAEQVKLTLKRHRLVSPQESRDGKLLTDPSLYEDVPLVTYVKD